MDIKKFILSTFAGGVIYFLLGYLFYAFLLEGFFSGHTVSGIAKSDDEMKFYPLVMGNFSLAALLSFIFLRWADIKRFVDGLRGGAIIGFLMTAGFNFIIYDTVKIMSFKGILADTVVFTLISALAGGIIAAVIGMGKKE
jgi:hypothetical protein